MSNTEGLRKALKFIQRHCANVIRTNSKDRGDWAEDMAYVGKVAADALAQPTADSAEPQGVGSAAIEACRAALSAPAAQAAQCKGDPGECQYHGACMYACGALSAPAAPSVPAWQPIETAPKGRILLVGYTNRAGKWRTVRGRYYEAETLDSEVSEDGWAPEGWYEEADNAEEINFTDEPPTHWMPLPAAPQPGAPTPKGDAHG